ncbi:MAG: 30S ribosomal protein S17 [Patescibacteria group bacterium]
MPNQTTIKNSIGRTLDGVVVAAGAIKTRTVLVTRSKLHSKYGRRFKTSRRYLAHDEQNKYQVGDRVVIIETRPLSKNKRWRILNKIN